MGSLIGLQSGQTTAGITECFEWEVQHSAFSRLRKGGPPEWIVDGIVYQGGRRFSGTGRSWMPVSFAQRF